MKTIIKILGTGCKNCVTLAENAQKALDELGMEAEVIKVTEMADIMGYGIMSTPGLVVDEKGGFLRESAETPKKSHSS